MNIIKSIKSFKAALNGIIYALKDENNFKIQLSIGTLVIITGFFIQLTYTEWIAIGFCIGIVLSTELFNSAIEKLCDLYDTKHNEKIKLIKDMSAGAVLIVAMVSAIIGIMIFLPALLRIINAE
jgi:diacylglycerol kinase